MRKSTRSTELAIKPLINKGLKLNGDYTYQRRIKTASKLG